VSLIRRQKNVSVVVITSEAEEAANACTTTTAELVDRWVLQHSPTNVERLHDPQKAGSKATKLNYAVSVILDRHRELKSSQIIFGIFDFDSRPMLGTIGELANFATREELPRLVQQVPFPLKAINQLPDFSIGKVLGITHLERALALEGQRYRNVDYAHSKGKAPSFLRGCMGASLFIRADVLYRVGEFPAESDDITLGYRLDLLGIRRRFLTTPNFVEPPPSAFVGFRQLLRIYKGVFTAVFEAKHFNKKIFSTPVSIKAAMLTHLKDAEPAARLLFSILASVSAWASGSVVSMIAVSVVVWALHACLFADLLRYSRRLSLAAGQPKNLDLHPVEWVIGPFAQGLLRLATSLVYFIRRLNPVRSYKLDDSTPRIGE